MIFQERTQGDFRIYAGAMEAARGGYTAALVIQQVCRATHSARETFRDDSLACGHRWNTAQEAIDYALGKARANLAKEHQRARGPIQR